MVIKCRNCGAGVSSDEKARKCRSCNALFPFACAVCARKLRPPLPDFPIERYFNDEGDPLCEDHYQRQCPECSRWFRADENPGFYLCHECTERREAQSEGGTIGLDATTSPHPQGPEVAGDINEDDATGARPASKSGCGAGMLMLAGLIFVTARALLG